MPNGLVLLDIELRRISAAKGSLLRERLVSDCCTTAVELNSHDRALGQFITCFCTLEPAISYIFDRSKYLAVLPHRMLNNKAAMVLNCPAVNLVWPESSSASNSRRKLKK